MTEGGCDAPTPSIGETQNQPPPIKPKSPKSQESPFNNDPNTDNRVSTVHKTGGRCGITIPPIPATISVIRGSDNDRRGAITPTTTAQSPPPASGRNVHPEPGEKRRGASTQTTTGTKRRGHIIAHLRKSA